MTLTEQMKADGQKVCKHTWHYAGTDYHGSHKGDDAYRCSKCRMIEYRPEQPQ